MSENFFLTDVLFSALHKRKNFPAKTTNESTLQKIAGITGSRFFSFFGLLESLHVTMVVGKDQVDSALEVAAESTLEVAPQRPQYQADPHWKPLPSDPGKQVAQDFGLEFAAKENIYQQEINVPRVPAQRLWTRTRIMSSIAIGLIIILAAVLGGVFGSRHKRSATASPTSPSNSSATSPFVTPTQRNIAAVSFTSNSANNTRVYFQDDVGQITEASNSAVNTTWGVKKTGFGGKNGSAIAAAVSRPSLPLVSLISFLSIETCRDQCRKSAYSISM